MRKAFTLMEVNLAMLIMAGGILSVVGLYSFGFRENRQSVEDVASAAVADAVVSPLVMAISATNLQWSKFRDVPSFPDEQGWGYFFNDRGVVYRAYGQEVFQSAMDRYSGCANGGDRVSFGFPSESLSASGLEYCGMVVMHDRDSPIVRIGFRASKTIEQLMSMPLYYTEVRFQGVIDQ